MTTLIGKGLRSLSGLVAKAQTGSLSSYVINAPHEYGQPLPAQADVSGLITPQRMRELAMKVPTVAAVVNTIVDFASGVEPKIRNVDPTIPATPANVATVTDLLRKPNPQAHWKRFVKPLMRDLITTGFAAAEIEENKFGGVANLWNLDVINLKVDYDKHGTILGYNQIDALGYPIRGKDGVHAWTPEQVVWWTLDPRSDSLYGTARLQQLFVCGVIESLMLNFIGNRFTDSNIPFGVMDLGEVSADEIDIAVASWNEQAEARGDHRVIITGSKGGAKWTPFNYTLKELDPGTLFAVVRKMMMGVMGVTANELGETDDVNKSNGYNLSFVFKHRSLYPLLDETYDTLSTFLVQDRMGCSDIEIGYEEIDSRDDLLQSQIDELQIKSGTATINEVRNRQGKTSISGGDDCYVFTGSAYIPVAMIGDFANAELQSIQMVNMDMYVQWQMSAAQAQAGNGAADPSQEGKVTTPIVRLPQLPESVKNPFGRGSSTPQLRAPRVKLNNKQETNPQRTRGPVQTMRQVGGVRKEAQ